MRPASVKRLPHLLQGTLSVTQCLCYQTTVHNNTSAGLSHLFTSQMDQRPNDLAHTTLLLYLQLANCHERHTKEETGRMNSLRRKGRSVHATSVYVQRGLQHWVVCRHNLTKTRCILHCLQLASRNMAPQICKVHTQTVKISYFVTASTANLELLCVLC
jgi:hypothetical protein